MERSALNWLAQQSVHPDEGDAAAEIKQVFILLSAPVQASLLERDCLQCPDFKTLANK